MNIRRTLITALAAAFALVTSAEAATEKWIAGSGQGLTYGSAGFSTEINSLGSGNAVQANSAINNSSALDIFADVSVSLGSITPTGVPTVGLYVYPLNEDGTTYGDGRFASAAAGPPPASYQACQIPLVASAGVQVGTCRGIVLPPGSFKFVLWNNSNVSLAASSNTVDYRTYNRAVN